MQFFPEIKVRFWIKAYNLKMFKILTRERKVFLYKTAVLKLIYSEILEIYLNVAKLIKIYIT